MSISFVLCFHLGLELGNNRGRAERFRGRLRRWQEGKWLSMEVPLGSLWETWPR